MFENLPSRSEILDTDYLAGYREEALTQDGIIPWPVIKNNLLSGLMIKNNYYKILQKINVSRSISTIHIKDSNNTLISFNNLSNAFMGIFQITCNKNAPSQLAAELKNILCLYDLKWIPKNLDTFSITGGPRVLPINYYAAGTGADTANDVNLPKSYQHIFIPPFNPQTLTGHFSLEVVFTSDLEDVDVSADISADIWITETT
jgi:hypothetical protein